jgi:tetratricopeptide (TPR) repeat protein
VPPAIDELVARMLAKDPTRRPRDASAVVRALDASVSERSSGSSSGVGDREKRMVTIVLARGLGVSVDGAIPLADGAKLIEFGGEDPATRAAAAALRLAHENPNASFAIATGRISDGHDGAYGPIIDRVATLASRTRGIAIDEVSAALLGDRFDIEGGALVGTTRTDTRPRMLLGKETPHVGRDKELALLDATFRECVGEPIARSVVVTGAAGSGKTRLAHELLARVRGDATVLIARGDPVGAGSSLGLARQLVRNAAALHDRDDGEAQHAKLREHLARYFAGDALDRAAEMLGELAGAPTAAPSAQLRAARDDARILASWLSRTFTDWMSALADAGPLLCVIEDLHWGDGASVAYLDDALRANAVRPLMLVALARSEVHDLFPSLWSRANVQELKLQGLTKKAAEKLVKSVLADASDDTVARIAARAGGNAFHIEELIRHVAAGRASSDADSLPETVLALAEARIARLEPEARRFLRVASVFGETFWEPAVIALLGGASSTLSRLVEAELVVEGPGRKFTREHQFRHGLLRDAAYAMLTETDRKALHVAAGGWLEEAGEKDALVLAEHFERGGERDRAAPHFLHAAARALESLNLGEARALAERGVRCGASGETLGHLRYLETMAAASSGQHAIAARAAKEAYQLLPRETVHWYGAAAYALSSGAYVGDVELAPMIIQDLLTTQPSEPTGPYGFAVQIAVDILDAIGQPEASDRLMERALSLTQNGDPDPAFRAYVVYGRTAMATRRDHSLGEVIYALDGENPASGELARRMFEFGGGILRFEVGDVAEAKRAFENTLRNLGDAPLFAAWSAIHIAWCELAEGRYGEAVAWARKAYELDPHHAYAAAAIAHLQNGEQSEAERLIARALDGIDDSLVTPWVVSTAYAVAARIALAGGRLEEADRCSAKHPTTGGSPYNRTFAEITRIEVLRAVGRDARAEIAALGARIERHRNSLPPELRAGFAKLPDNARALELAQR